jgi:uncharacterized protein (DUF1800 family)
MSARPWTRLTALAVLAGAGPSADAQHADAQRADAKYGALTWGAREAEHLYNRAGFGARPEQIARAVELGREAVVAELLAGAARDPFFYEPPHRAPREEVLGLTEDARRKLFAERQREQNQLLHAFAGWWVEEMLDGSDPLRERMTLFWHGYFTSSFRDLRDPLAMIRQNDLLREHALGRFEDLLKGIVRDPAMLEYLDNDQNRKRSPNENFARELMELFTLGEGHYSEVDVKEAARALTGWIVRPGEDPRLVRRRHDRGDKTILGKTGDFGADELVGILLEHPACSRFVAGRVLAYFEGQPPEEERLAAYAELLVTHDYRISDLLEALFNDPHFYSDEVVAQRIAGPIDFLVGSARRLGVEPPGELVWLAAGQIGQRLLDPPNVRGWEGGRNWITTATLLQRGNMAGMMLGVVKPLDLIAEDPALSMESMERDPETPEMMQAEGELEPEGRQPGPGAARAGKQQRPRALAPDLIRMARVLAGGWRPGIHLSSRCQRSGALLDVQIVELFGSDFLAVPLTPEGRITLLGFLERERSALGAADGHLFDGEHGIEAEMLLRRLAHLTLSLPEAQLD